MLLRLISLSLLLNGKRPWRGNLKERYEELVNTFVNTPEANRSMTKASDDDFVSEKRGGGAEGTRTPDFLLAKEALSQLSYSPTMRGTLRAAGAAARAFRMRITGSGPDDPQ